MATQNKVTRKNLGAGTYRLYRDGVELGDVTRGESRLGERRWRAHPSVDGALTASCHCSYEPTMSRAIRWLTEGASWMVTIPGFGPYGYYLDKGEAIEGRTHCGVRKAIVVEIETGE